MSEPFGDVADDSRSPNGSRTFSASFGCVYDDGLDAAASDDTDDLCALLDVVVLADADVEPVDDLDGAAMEEDEDVDAVEDCRKEPRALSDSPESFNEPICEAASPSPFDDSETVRTLTPSAVPLVAGMNSVDVPSRCLMMVRLGWFEAQHPEAFESTAVE